MVSSLLRVAVLGASGYTGAELLRLLAEHPHVEVVFLGADRKAGQDLSEVFPQFVSAPWPRLETLEVLFHRLDNIDVVFTALPHGTTQNVVAELFLKKPSLKVIDLSADYRLSPDLYAQWYDHPHAQISLQKEAVYGLVEVYRKAISQARLVANPGCYTTASILALRPLVAAGLIRTDRLTIDAKSGVTGAGRSLKEGNLFCEVAEGFHAYGVGHHRHMGEIDEQLSLAAGYDVKPSFTPHLVPMNRGILVTCYAQLVEGASVEQAQIAMQKAYASEPFVHVMPVGQAPQTRHVRGTNRYHVAVCRDRHAHGLIVIGALDNLVKGASGQAVQNMNVMMGWSETLGLPQYAMMP